MSKVEESGQPEPHGYSSITYDRDRMPAKH